MKNNITFEVCPDCKAKLSAEEIKNQECWACKWNDEHDNSHEWDFDDDEVMPNVLRQYPGGLI
jgi:hypothetical protein